MSIPAISEMPYRSRLFNREGALRREKERLAILRAPLCPAGHLPHFGGRSAVTAAFANPHRRRNGRSAKAANLPPRGEDAKFGKEGRTEGGAVPPSSGRAERRDNAADKIRPLRSW
ncbi:conserved hypothetical protein [Mesorhizobium delmotii]|uniref:Uncharacterized protein n=1 Tax=Mesorhizobium delmotii TaxID=1631247 RepID=A0A2P9AFY7_9HYPH|nr:conserved hypothetical protein [Mesorhizobium delmotii]